MCKSCKQIRSYVCGLSQPGGLLVTVAAVTTAVLQGEEESTDVTAIHRWTQIIFLSTKFYSCICIYVFTGLFCFLPSCCFTILTPPYWRPSVELAYTTQFSVCVLCASSQLVCWCMLVNKRAVMFWRWGRLLTFLPNSRCRSPCLGVGDGCPLQSRSGGTAPSW